MDMRVDAARDRDLPRGVDDPPGAEGGKAARRADRGDFFAGDTDIGWLRSRRKDGETARDDNVENMSLPMIAKPPP